MSPKIALPFPTRPNDLRGSYSISSSGAKLGARGPSVSAPRCHLPIAARQGGRSAIDAFFAVAGLDEAALSLERGDIGAGQFLGNLAQSGAPGGEAFDQPLVDRLAFAVLIRTEGCGDVHVAVDQPREVDRHQ